MQAITGQQDIEEDGCEKYNWAKAGNVSDPFGSEVRPSNERAVALYRHFGFRQIGLRKAYYPAVDGREDALVFDKELA